LGLEDLEFFELLEEVPRSFSSRATKPLWSLGKLLSPSPGSGGGEQVVDFDFDWGVILCSLKVMLEEGENLLKTLPQSEEFDFTDFASSGDTGIAMSISGSLGGHLLSWSCNATWGNILKEKDCFCAIKNVSFVV
jgi:hypothetical protein